MIAASEVIGGPALEAALRAAGEVGLRALARGLRREAERVMTLSKREFVPADFGTLRDSGVVFAPVITATEVSVEFGFGGAASKYAVYVHEGTGPAVGRPAFMPPLSAIRPWLRRHGIPEKLAFAYAYAIGRRGLRPTKYLERPLLVRMQGMETRLAAYVTQELERLHASR